MVVRRWLTHEEREASGRTVTDVIGLVVETDPRGIAIRPDSRDTAADAPPVRIAADQIVAGKPIPPRPRRRSPRAD